VDYGSVTALTGNTTYKRTLVAAATGAVSLAITPSNDFNGAVDNVTVKAITGTVPSIFVWQDSAGTVVNQVRGSAALSNAALGLSALRSNTTGYSNSAMGQSALYSNTTGYSNSAMGQSALYSNTTGNFNSAVGLEAGYTDTPANANVSGSNNVWVGYQAGPGTATQLTNSIGIGYRSKTLESNHAVFGNSSITRTTLYGTVEIPIAKLANSVEATCDATARGQVVMVHGGAGVADTLRVCRKDASDNYAWTGLY
jgi:hypothetical protein